MCIPNSKPKATPVAKPTLPVEVEAPLTDEVNKKNKRRKGIKEFTVEGGAKTGVNV